MKYNIIISLEKFISTSDTDMVGLVRVRVDLYLRFSESLYDLFI